MRKYLFGTLVFLLAFVVLSVSVLRSASPKYAFVSPSPEGLAVGDQEKIEIDYQLPFPGRILPDSPLWPIKALRDKLWHAITFDVSKEAELSILCSDKRLGMSKILFERGKPELAFSTLTKAEKYLEDALVHERLASKRGDDTTEILESISKSALKHRQLIDEILILAPEDAKPEIIKVQDYSKNVYKEAASSLNSKGVVAPNNPFDGD